VRYFADRHGVPRAAIEGTNIPLELIRRYARRGAPMVELRDGRRPGLSVVRRTEYAGFELDSQRTPLVGPFPPELADAARDTLAAALVEGRTPHADQHVVRRAAERLVEYWRRSGGRLTQATRAHALQLVRAQLDTVNSWEQFLATPVSLDVAGLVPEAERRGLDALPSAASLLGDRVPLIYEVEAGLAVVRLRLKEGQARRLRSRDLPAVDRPLRLSVLRGRREVLRAASIDELRSALAALPRKEHGRSRRRR
jgi:ATP-dependent helicase HrpA